MYERKITAKNCLGKEKGRLYACISVKQPVWADCEQEGKEHLLQDADRQMKEQESSLLWQTLCTFVMVMGSAGYV